MKSFGFVIVAAAVVLLAACRGPAHPPAVISYDGKVFEAHGWKGAMPAGGWGKVFAVYASQEPGSPPMAGAYERHGGTIIFTPAFAPAAGISLRARFTEPGGEIASAIFSGPHAAAAGAPTSVAAVYPTTAEWPANQLKFYIQFSGPMTRGEAWNHIILMDDKGVAVRGPFVEIDQELWSPDMTRLTVLFDPGRLKRGLVDNMNAGPPLVPGKHYTLKVDRGWHDAAGRFLTGEMLKPIVAVPAVRLPVDPATWRVTPPASASAPLVVDFPRPMDHALALRVITVEGTPGTARLENDEKRWIFTPDHPWVKGDYQLHIDGVLEDLAGNRLHQLFDVDTRDPAQTAAPPKFDRVAFRVQ